MMRDSTLRDSVLAIHSLPRDIAGKVWRAPLLLGWLIIGPLVALGLYGVAGLIEALVNLLLLALWVFLIRRMTPEPAEPLPVRRPALELAAGLLLLALLFIVQILDFGVVTVSPWSGWVRMPFAWMYRSVFSLSGAGLPAWLQQDVFLALSSSVKQLIPTLVIFMALGYTWRGMGLKPCCGRLIALLVLLTVLLGLPSGALLQLPAHQVLVMYLVGIFINGLPEELLFRGLLLARLEAVLGSSLNALVISAWLFNAIHIPINLANGTDLLRALLEPFSIGFPSGLLWGYLYLRTRSVWPGALWHASQANLGYLLVSFSH